jgi:CheY-like chemotaxis protein
LDKKRGTIGMADKKQVLIVDDDYLVRTVIGKVAEKYGAVVTMADNGKEGRDAIGRKNDFDLVFLDLLMPQNSGWDVLDSIRSNTETADIPVVIVSGAPISDTEKQKLSEKVTTFVNKETFSLAEFERIVGDLLNSTEA